MGASPSKPAAFPGFGTVTPTPIPTSAAQSPSPGPIYTGAGPVSFLEEVRRLLSVVSVGSLVLNFVVLGI